jgi:F-type H+-transporting ATPase subunit a
MEHQLALTRFLNEHFGAWVTQLLLAMHIHPMRPSAPITNAFAMELLCFSLMVLLFIIIRSSLSIEKPGAAQHMAEMYDDFIHDQGSQIIGPGYERFVPYVATLFLFILICNLLGLIPGFASPTAYVVVPLGFALPTFLYYHYFGIKTQGFKYFKHFLGPIWWLSWLILPIEIISHLARVLSLTVRLYANMFAGDMVTLAFFSLIPIGIPIVFLVLHLFVSVVQAVVFMLLALIYLAGAVVVEEH